jgi:hypothetical protein
MPSRLLVAGNNRGGDTTVGWQRETDMVAFVGGGPCSSGEERVR